MSGEEVKKKGIRCGFIDSRGIGSCEKEIKIGR